MMPWGKIGIVALIALVAFGGTLLIVRDGPPPVDALELDDDGFRREDDGADLEVNEDDDGDDTGTGTRTGKQIATTDDGRDGTREGDTRTNGVGTGTGNSNGGARVGGGGGGGTDTGGGSISRGGSNSGGNST